MADGTPAFVRGGLPNEAVSARPIEKRGDGWLCAVERIITPSPDRATPPCPHFGTCGGCTLQHWSAKALAEWKAGQIAAALSRAGFAWTARPPVPIPPDTRRRMDLAILRLDRTVHIGLHAAASSRIVPIPHCHVLHPVLRALLDPLTDLLPRLACLRREGSALLNLLDSGPDLLLRHDAPLTATDRQHLAAFAAAHGIPRIAVQQGRTPPETACQLGPVQLNLSGITVQPPPGAFLQPSREGEAQIVSAILAGLPASLTARSRVIELFAGCGTLSAALATRSQVSAFEGDAEAAAALARAGSSRIGVTVRDLARRPLIGPELARAAAIVLDPPYAGAGPQMPHLAAARIPAVLYVSCNPAALGRDAAILAAVGYKLAEATVIDQFAWSPHVEAVAVFVL